MPIFSYFVGVGTVLVALLFVADAALEKRATPIITTSSLYGLPKPWQPAPTQTLAAAPAPAPDMSSAAVLAAMPKTASAPNTEPVNQRRVTADTPKKKRVAQKQQQQQQQWGDYRQSYAWSPPQRNPFGGGGFFGRF